MTCSICGGRVEWQGPLVNLTHTKCLDCGGENCQEIELDHEEQAAQAGKGAYPDSLADMLPSHGAGHVPALSDEAIDRAFDAEQQAGKDVTP